MVSVPVFVLHGSLAVLSDSTLGLGLDESDHQFNYFFALKINIKTHIKYCNNVDVPIIIIVEISCLSIVIKIFTKKKENKIIKKMINQ